MTKQGKFEIKYAFDLMQIAKQDLASAKFLAAQTLSVGSLVLMPVSIFCSEGVAKASATGESAPFKTHLDDGGTAVGLSLILSSRYRAPAPGGSFDLGLYRKGAVQLETSFSYQLTDFAPELSRREIRGSITVKYFVFKSLYLLAGSGLQEEQFNGTSHDFVPTSSDVVFTIGGFAWTAMTWGVEAGFGNRWAIGSTYLGVQWLEVYLPVATLQSSFNSIPQGVHNVAPSSYSLRGATVQCGLLF